MNIDPWDDVDLTTFKESRFSRDSILNFIIPILKEFIKIIGILFIVYFVYITVIIRINWFAFFIFVIPIVLFIDLLTGKFGIWKAFMRELLFRGAFE